MKTIALNILALVLFILGCKDNVSDISLYEEPSTLYKNATLPLSLNNKWAYVDSNYFTDGKLNGTRLDVSTISKYRRENNQDWWLLSSDNGLAYDFTIVNDTVFMKSNMNGLPNSRLEYLPSINVSDTIYFKQTAPFSGAMITVKVYLYNGGFVTPAGLFDSVYVYDSFWSGLDMRVVKYFKPQVGLLGYDSYWPGNSTALSNKNRIVYYSLIK